VVVDEPGSSGCPTTKEETTMTTRRIVGIDLGVTSSHTVVVSDETTAGLTLGARQRAGDYRRR
jgi:hypothetical protein